MKRGDLVRRIEPFGGDLFSEESGFMEPLGVRIQMGEACVILEVRGDPVEFGSALKVLHRGSVVLCSPHGMEVIS